MIRLVIEVDDHSSWGACTKEAVAERLADLGGVRVVDVKVDKPQQTVMEGMDPRGWKDVCPRCGARVVRVMGPEGTAVEREIRPRPFWPDPAGPDWAMDIEEKWRRGRLEGELDTQHTVGFAIHRCEG